MIENYGNMQIVVSQKFEKTNKKGIDGRKVIV